MIENTSYTEKLHPTLSELCLLTERENKGKKQEIQEEEELLYRKERRMKRRKIIRGEEESWM